MQIHEITWPVLNEAGLTDYLKAMATTDPRLAALPLDQRAAAMRTSSATQMAAKAAANQWQGRVLQLLKANQVAGGSGMLDAQGVTDQEYGDNLEDFVEKMMLQKPIESLDQTSGTKVAQMIDKVVTAKNDPKQIQAAFQELAAVTAAARQDPTKTTGVSNPQQIIQQALTGVNPQVLGKQIAAAAGGQQAAKSTGNPTVDHLLKTLGIQVS